MKGMNKDQKVIFFVLAGGLVLYLLYRYYQANNSNANNQAGAPADAAAQYAALAGQEQSDVATLQKQEQGDIQSLEQFIAGLATQQNKWQAAFARAQAAFQKALSDQQKKQAAAYRKQLEKFEAAERRRMQEWEKRERERIKEALGDRQHNRHKPQPRPRASIKPSTPRQRTTRYGGWNVPPATRRRRH